LQDDRTKRIVEARLASLRSSAFVEALKAANRDFERTRAQSFPYMSPGLFMLVGPKPDADWPELVRRRFLPPEPQQDIDELDQSAALD
jgi:hypothetical protein